MFDKNKLKRQDELDVALKKLKLPPPPTREVRPRPGRPTNAELEEKRNKEGSREEEIDPETKKQLKEFVKRLLDVDNELSDEEIINMVMNHDFSDNNMAKKQAGSGKSVTNAASPLEKTKKMLEDVQTINILRDLIHDDKMKRQFMTGNPQAPVTSKQEGMDNPALLSGLLQGMVDKGNGIDPQMLMFLTSQGGQNNNSFNQILTYLTVMKMWAAQSQNQPTQVNAAGQPVQVGNNAVILEMINSLLERVNAMQSKPSVPQYNPIEMMAYQNMFKPQNDTNQTQAMLLAIKEIMQNNQTQNYNAIVQNQQLFLEKMARGFQEAIYSLQGRQDPKKDFLETLSITKELLGERVNKNEKELEHDFKLRELDFKDQERKDKLELQKATIQRDASQSDMYSRIGEELINTGMNLFGGVVSKVMDGKQQPGVISTPTKITRNALRALKEHD